MVPKGKYIDPLIISAWIQQRGFSCELWAKDHCEIKTQAVPIVTAVMIESHWIPVVLKPAQELLHVHTWDGVGISHEALDVLLRRLAIALGFTDILVCREQRMFFSSTLCGALAISFVRSVLVGNQLPTSHDEAQYVHDNLRSRFAQALQESQIAPRPWIWGAGDPNPGPEMAPEALTPATIESLSMERDQRIDLINERGPEMADDEMRFHILNLVRHQIPRQTVRGSFTFFEPLVFTCWDSIGETIATQWSNRNPQIFDQGQHVATAVCLDNHWLPLWFVPSGPTLQIHTFNDLNDVTSLDDKLHAIARCLGFQEVAMHRIPKLLPDNQRCGAYALAFLAHVMVRMPLPTSDQELSYLHTNMRASFVQYLYSVSCTPRPVVWGSGPKGESRPLPRLPGLQPTFQADGSASSHSQHAGTLVPNEDLLRERTAAIATHGHAMGDDEILFHLNFILSKYRDASLPSSARQFVVLPPLILRDWLQGDPLPLIRWSHEHLSGPACPHILAVIWVDNHWIPGWLEPTPDGVKCHTLHFPVDQAVGQTIFSDLAGVLGFPTCVIHWAPYIVYESGLCGPMALSFLAHIALGARLPLDDLQLRHRSWDMKQKFADSLTVHNAIMPVLWGWTGTRESGPLPRMPVWDPFVSRDSDFCHVGNYPPEANCHDGPLTAPVRHGQAMGHDEMLFHTHQLMKLTPGLMGCVITHGYCALVDWLTSFARSAHTSFAAAFLLDAHWTPILAHKHSQGIVLALEHCSVSTQVINDFAQWTVCELPSMQGAFCGAMTIGVFTSMAGFDFNEQHIQCFHDLLRHQFHHVVGHPCDNVKWGAGPGGLLTKNLAAELLKHGIPPDVVEARAAAAIRSIGSDQILTALQHRQPWKQLKLLGNNANFKFVLPSELETAVEANKGKPVSAKGKGKSKKGSARFVSPDLDPHKLQILDGTFSFQKRPVSQIQPTQLGPLSSGVILMSRVEAEPYLRAGKQVSQEPLALAVLGKCDSTFSTPLPHVEVTVPCRCTVDQEPILADAVLVQVGSGLIEKHAGHSVVQVDSFDVVTLKLLVYRDELKLDWAEFCQWPIKHLVQVLPLLRSCHEQACTCPHWHNTEQVPLKDPILDVWRRQFLGVGFKPNPAAQASIFSVCVRIPKCLLGGLLALSGTCGAYCEPRSADGLGILPDYTVVWTPKHSAQEIQHLMRTNPAVFSLARLGDRRGLRVLASHAKTIHDLVRPDTVFLPQGPKCQYTVGPMPYGVDRQAVAKVLSATGWECRPLQPTTPCPGRGVMWMVQSTEEPVHTIVQTSHGEIVISKQRQITSDQVARQSMVGSAKTLALCEVKTDGLPETDPWIKQDPWGGFKPVSVPVAASSFTDGVHQLEERIQSSVMSKLSMPMDHDLPDRVVALEGQVQQLLSQQQQFDAQMTDFNSHHTQQLNALQTQVNVQSQQLHGHLENQNQTIQSLFEQQMTQIRTLLSKRSRDDGME